MAKHKVFREFNVTETELLDALANGFRARADVKGKIAELKLSKVLKKQKKSGVISDYEWFDKDGFPDFLVTLLIEDPFWTEVKNVKSPKSRAAPKGTAVPAFCTVEVWKSRNGKDKNGKPTRKYKTTAFKVLAACLHNQDPKRRWKFRFIHAGHLTRDAEGYINALQTVDVYGDDRHWHDNLIDAYNDAPVVSAVEPIPAAA